MFHTSNFISRKMLFIGLMLVSLSVISNESVRRDSEAADGYSAE
jgi:hypothetical protein